MFQTEEEYNKDNGYKSRKFLLSLLSILLIAILGTVFAIWGLEVGIFSTIATSTVGIALGYSGISATRSAVPRVAQTKQEQTRDNSRKPKTPKVENNSNEPKPEEGDV